MADNQGKMISVPEAEPLAPKSAEVTTPPAPEAPAAIKAASPVVAPKPMPKPAATPPSAKAPATPRKAKAAPKVKPAVKAKAAPKPKTKTSNAKPDAAIPSKGQLNMNDMLTKFAEQAKANAEAFTAQFGERAKDAFAKSSKLAEESAAFNKSNVEALVESGKVAVKNIEVLRDESLSYMRKSFEESSAAMKSMTSVSSPAEFFKLCAENNRKAMDYAVAQASKNSEMLVKMSSDVFAPLSNRMSVVSAQMKMN